LGDEDIDGTDVKDVGYKGVDSIDLVQDRDQWRICHEKSKTDVYPVSSLAARHHPTQCVISVVTIWIQRLSFLSAGDLLSLHSAKECIADQMTIPRIHDT
jgi:hypothetical protein